ncbi:MAG: dienelactone hydrolase family protein, partial [Polyangiaceae bacterium]
MIYATTPGDLHGFLYHPAGLGPFPAVVFEHGSEQEPGNMIDEAQFFVPHGFVVFAPHRRGQGRSAEAAEYLNEAWIFGGKSPELLVDLLDTHVDDVAAAVAYVRRLPFVDANRVALAGCSFGGIEALLAAERNLGLRAAVDFEGAAIMWSRTPPLQERMKRAARAATVPVLFVQAENDFDTTPSRVLGREMELSGRTPRVRIFPPNGTTAKDGHMFCMGGTNPRWGDEV